MNFLNFLLLSGFLGLALAQTNEDEKEAEAKSLIDVSVFTPYNPFTYYTVL